MSRKKLLILLSSDIYIRNYITTDALEEVEEDFECHYLVSNKVTLADKLSQKKYVYRYKVDTKLSKRHFDSFNVVMWRFRKLSSAFEFRFRRKFDVPVKWADVHGLWSLLLYFARWAVRRVRVFRIKIIGSRLFFPWYRRSVIDKIPLNNDLVEHVRRIQPDVIVYTSSAYDPEGIDLVKIGRQMSIKTIFLIDNWDNLSSKTLMLNKPDFVTVWGKQNLEHAMRIHGFASDDVFLIGTPRFDEYFRQRNRQLPSHFSNRYVLFLGCAIPFDEATALTMLNNELASAPDIYGDLEIVYRPHPWRQGKDSILGLSLPHVRIDPQVEANYRSTKGVAFQPPLTYYPALLSNAEFVTGPLTSMLIESLVFYKRILGIVYDDGKNVTSPHNALKYYPHFEGLEKMEGLTFTHRLEDLAKDFRNMWQGQLQVNKSRLDEQRRYYLYDDNFNYKTRLRNVLNTVANKGL